jgi:DNA polymerase elongation subunit (family B)
MIGIKTNKGYQKVIECSNEDEERRGLVEFFRIIDDLKPSIIGGYNSANFDWYWIFERCKALNVDIKKICRTLNPNHNIKQTENLLKLANEVERYNQVGMWGYNVIDIIHSVRRAQARLRSHFGKGPHRKKRWPRTCRRTRARRLCHVCGSH